MTEIKSPTNQELKRSAQVKSLKRNGIKLVVVLGLLGLVGLFLFDLYTKREALTFAYMHSKQVVEVKESYDQEMKTAELRLSKNLSRSYLDN